MALFPAYKNLNIENQSQGKDSNLSWLQNDSCPSNITIVGRPDFNEGESNRSSLIDDDLKLNNIESFLNQDVFTHQDGINKIEINCKNASHQKVRKRKRKQDGKSKCDRKYSDICSLISTRNHNKNIFIENSILNLKPEDIIYLDNGGDKNNVLFPTTHYTQMAKYNKRRKSYLGDKQNKSKKKKNKLQRYFHKYYVDTFDSLLASSLSNKDKYPENIEEFSFIPLENNMGNKTVGNSSNYLNILDPSTENYILGKGNLTEIVEIQDTSEHSFWKMRVKEYNEMVQKEPNNIDLWLKFVQLQDQVDVIWFDKKCKNTTKSSLAHVIEKKIAILDVAIRKNENCKLLYVKRVQIGQEIWDQECVIEEWDKLLNKFPNDIFLWHELLTFYQTYYLTFHLNNVIKIHIKYKEKLLQEALLSAQNDFNDYYYQLINGVVQLAYLWRQGGYSERSTSLFQALIELNFYCPPSLKKSGISQEIVIEIFEAFWDSQAPRFGEKNSVGWNKFMEKRENVSFPEEVLGEVQDEEDSILSNRGDTSTANLWLKLELYRELNHWLPWQYDPELCEDSERLVNFCELKPHLFIIESEKGLFYLVLQFLSFLGATIPVCIWRNCDYKDPNSSLTSLRIESLQEMLMKMESIDTMEELSEEFYFPAIGPSIKKLDDVYFQYVRNVIKLLMDLFSAEYQVYLTIILIRLFSEKCLVLKTMNYISLPSVVKGFKKQIKQILKRPDLQNNLEIFYEFALFEKNLKNFDESLKIHAMSLTLGLQGTNLTCSKSKNDVCLLLKHMFSVIKIEFLKEEVSLDRCAINFTQNLICSIVLDNKLSIEPTPPSSIKVLKAKRKLNDMIDTSLSIVKAEVDVDLAIGYYITFLALLQLITSGYKPACLVFEDFLTQLNKIGLENLSKASKLLPLKELVYENYVWFQHLIPNLRHIYSILPVSPIAMRNIIDAAVEVSPNNLYFLRKLSNCQFKLWQDILLKIKNLDSKQEASILVSIFQLLPHIRRVILAKSDIGGGDSNYQLLSCLESAVKSTSGRHCPLLWRLFLRVTNHMNPRNLKTLIYRAMDNCPFAKSVYLDCIRFVPDSHLEILKVMSEKGIRVRLPLEELNLLLEVEEEPIQPDTVEPT